MNPAVHACVLPDEVPCNMKSLHCVSWQVKRCEGFVQSFILFKNIINGRWTCTSHNTDWSTQIHVYSDKSSECGAILFLQTQPTYIWLMDIQFFSEHLFCRFNYKWSSITLPKPMISIKIHISLFKHSINITRSIWPAMVKCRKQKQSKNKIRITDDQTIAQFQMLLQEVTWDTV